MKTIKMKKQKLIALSMLLFLGVSCSDDFLVVTPTGSLADAQVQTEPGINNLLIGAYSALNGVFGNRFEGPNHWVTGSIMGGDANKGTDSGDYSTINPVQRYAHDATQGDLNNLWRGRFEGVSRANAVMAALAGNEGIAAGTRASLAGQARLLRGHFYFDLKKHFNSVPVFDETVEAADIILIPNTPDVWPQIEADFQFAYDNLPAVTGKGRVNKWAAAVYMGKAKLFQGKFAEAKTWFDDAIANGVTSDGQAYALVANYNDNYNALTENNSESVMDVESASGTGSVQNANAFDDLNYPYNTGSEGPGNCCGFFQPSIELGNSFRTGADGLPLLDGTYNDPANAVANNFKWIEIDNQAEADFVEDANPLDPRIDFAVGRIGIPYLDWKEHPGTPWIRSFGYAGPYSPKKYIYYKENEAGLTDTSSWTRGYATMNYQIIRYADVLLMAAEAEIESGSLEQARTYVNMVRNRAANPAFWVKEYISGADAANYVISEYPMGQFASQESARQAVRFERKIELSGEGHRFFDLVRWGVAATDLNAYLSYESQFLTEKFGGANFTAGKNEYQPIPQAQLDLQPGVLTQNENW